MGPLVMGAAGAVSGLTKVVGSLIGGRKRRREQRKAQGEYNTLKSDYANLDDSNLYLDQENMYEDLTVNQQEAKFAAEQQQQALSNTLAAQNQAAGGSGIASLAQALANQQSKNLATSAISIGQQERQNQMLERNAAANIQQQELAGAEQARNLNWEKTETLLGMSGQRLAAANQARTDATKALVGGIGSMAGGALQGYTNSLGEEDGKPITQEMIDEVI